MSQPPFTLIFFALLSLGLFMGVPAEDLAETAFDESESQPCEGTALFSIAGADTLAQAPTLRCRTSLLRLGSSIRLGTKLLSHGLDPAHQISNFLVIFEHSLRC